MPYAESEGTRIHYRVDGSGPPLILQHGFFWSLDGWERWGYVDALKADFQLVIIDARGHGGSDKPHDSAAYSLSHHVLDILAVLDDLEIPSAHYWGFSMGGGSDSGWQRSHRSASGPWLLEVLTPMDESYRRLAVPTVLTQS